MTLFQKFLSLFGREYILSKESSGWRLRAIRFIGAHPYSRSSSSTVWEKLVPMEMEDTWLPVTKGIEAYAILVHDTETPMTQFHRIRKEIVKAARSASFAMSGPIESSDRTKMEESFEAKLSELLA